MSAHDLVRGLREHQVAHLGPCVDRMQGLERVGVPEPDMAVRSATSRCEQAVLVWGPADGLDRGCVFSELCQGFIRVQVPYHQFVVVATRCELLVVKAPLKPTNFLLVALKGTEHVIRVTQVTHVDVTVSAARADNRAVPRDRANSALVTS